MLFQLKDTTVDEITPHDQDGEYVDSGLCPTCWGSEWEDGYVSVKVTFGNGETYTYYRTEDEIQQQGLAGVRDDLNTLRGLYIVTAMRKALLPKYSYTNKPGIQKYKDDIIQLPVKPGTDEINYTEDDIDWVYIESYIRTMEKQVIADVVDYKDSMITTAKELVYV